MDNFTEHQSALIAIDIIGHCPGCTMDYIIDRMEDYYCFNSFDLGPSPSRPFEPRYKQIVRNMNSHYENGNEFSEFVSRIYDGSIGAYRFYLAPNAQNAFNEKESEQLNERIDDEIESNKILNTPNPYTNNFEIERSSNRLPEMFIDGQGRTKYQTDHTLAKTIVLNANNHCDLEDIINTNHCSFITKYNEVYLEAHHLIPMKAQSVFGNINLDCAANIIPLCPVCHRAVHYGNMKEKIERLKPLYDSRIQYLNAHGIVISFEDLLNEFYH